MRSFLLAERRPEGLRQRKRRRAGGKAVECGRPVRYRLGSENEPNISEESTNVDD